MKIVVLLFALLVLSISAGNAEETAFQGLQSARALRCRFDLGGSTTSWDTGSPVTEAGKMSGLIHFDSIDRVKRTARMIGNVGAGDVAALPTRSGLTFIEQTDSGNLVITTVFASYRRGTSDFIAVMSRHMDMVGPFISQHHGTCMSQ